MRLFSKAYGDGHPLLILHGLLGASGNWHTLSRTVFSSRYHVCAIDQRNHGRSPHSDVHTYTAMADDVVELMEEEAFPSAYVLGHSMGGKTAMHLATHYPERTDALIVVDIAPRAYDARHDTIFEALHAVDPAAYDDRRAIDAALAERIGDVGVRQFLLKNLTLDAETKTYSWQMNLAGLSASYAGINEALPEDARYGGPALFIRGGRSDYIQDADEALIRHHFPQARLVTIPGAGHWVHAEAPEPLATAVMDFLAEAG